MADKSENKTIEDVVGNCQELYGLIVNENINSYIRFIERQLYKNPKLDLNFRPEVKRGKGPLIYFDLLVDELYIFGVLKRIMKVKEEFNEDGTLMDSYEKLKLLGSKGTQEYFWNDEKLYKVYMRRYYAKKKYPGRGLKSFCEIIDEVGEDSEVVDLWGAKLSYTGNVGRSRKNK